MNTSETLAAPQPFPSPTEDAQTRYSDLCNRLTAMPSEERAFFLRFVAPMPYDLEKLIAYLRLRAQAQALENECPLVKAMASASGTDVDWKRLADCHSP